MSFLTGFPLLSILGLILWWSSPGDCGLTCIPGVQSSVCYWHPSYSQCFTPQVTFCSNSTYPFEALNSTMNYTPCQPSNCLGPTGPLYATAKYLCGDGRCNGDETCSSCPYDCGLINNVTCGAAFHDCPGYPRGTRVASLTFHGGPSKYTTDVLNMLAEENIKATFFLSGVAASMYPNLVIDIINQGHLIGSRTYGEYNLPGLSVEGMQDEMALADLEFAIALPNNEKPIFMSPPQANITTAIADQLRQWDFQPVLWNVDSQDWAGTNEATAKDAWLRLFYDVRNNTARTSQIYAGSDQSQYAVYIAQRYIDYLRFSEMNFTFVRLDKCILGEGDTSGGYVNRSLSTSPVEPLILAEGEGWVAPDSKAEKLGQGMMILFLEAAVLLMMHG